MARKLVYSGLVAGLLCGCQSTKQNACCDDCLPPPTYCGGYNSYCDNFITTATASDCAKSDLKDLKKSCGKRSGDFEAGFQQAYIDLAMGRLAAVPPIPPRKYWTAYYRSCSGSGAVADWFEGYRLGLSMGSQNGVSHFNRIATSWDGQGDGPDAAWNSSYGNGVHGNGGHSQTISTNHPQYPAPGTTNPAPAVAGRNGPMNPVPASNGPPAIQSADWSRDPSAMQRASLSPVSGSR